MAKPKEDPLVSKEEMQEAGIMANQSSEPARFVEELRTDMRKKILHDTNVLGSLAQRSGSEKPIKLEYKDYPEGYPIEDIIHYSFTASPPLLAQGKSIVSRTQEDYAQVVLRDSHKRMQLYYIFDQIKNSGGEKIHINVRDKDGYKQNNLRSIYEGVWGGLSEKDLYVMGRLYQAGVLVDLGIDKKYIHNIQNISVFERIIELLPEMLLEDTTNIKTETVYKYYEILELKGEESIEQIRQAWGKTRNIQEYADKYHVRLRLDKEYSREIIYALEELSIEDLKDAFDLNLKIEQQQHDTPGIYEKDWHFSSLAFTADLIRRYVSNKSILEIESDFLERNNLKNYRIAVIAPLLILERDRLPIVDGIIFDGQKAAGEKYINDQVSKKDKLAEFFEVSEVLRPPLKHSSGSVLKKTYKTTNWLNFLIDKRELNQFIKDNFEIGSLEDVAKVMENLWNNRNDANLYQKFRVLKKLQSQDKIVDTIVFLKPDYSAAFLGWLVDLRNEIGFDIYKEVLEDGYLTKKVGLVREWYQSPLFREAKKLGIFKNAKNIYKYQPLARILQDKKFWKFLSDNDDIQLLQIAIEKITHGGESEMRKWYNDQDLFYAAKGQGLFPLSGQSTSSNLDKYEVVERIHNDRGFWDFAADNRDLYILQKAVNANYGAGGDGETSVISESLKSWYNDPESLDVARRVGIFDVDKLYGQRRYVGFYEKFVGLGRLKEAEITQLEEVLNKILDEVIIHNIPRIIAPSKKKDAIYFNTFVLCLEEGLFDNREIDGFPVTKKNCLDYLDKDEPLIDITKDRGLVSPPIPWTKAWFVEDEKRRSYMNKDAIQTFKKFGTNIGMALLGGVEDLGSFRDSYEKLVTGITRQNERSTMLQVGEIFSLLISRGNYHFFDTIVVSETGVGDTLKSFVEDYSISEKGKTILTLMFAREVNTAYQVRSDQQIETIVKGVYEKIVKYDEVLKRYAPENIPDGLRTSIGLEYEVTRSIAQGYHKRTASNYKEDIEILSSYSGIAKGEDAVHEIATKPTDNPYLLLLEMRLLGDLDFVDLNFEHLFKDTDYEKGARGFHVSLGGEFGVECNGYANFIQNSLIAGNLGGINAGNKVDYIQGIRDRTSNYVPVFEKHTPATEYRGLSIDRAEPFERCMVSIFNLNMAKRWKNILLLHQSKCRCGRWKRSKHWKYLKRVVRNRG